MAANHKLQRQNELIVSYVLYCCVNMSVTNRKNEETTKKRKSFFQRKQC